MSILPTPSVAVDTTRSTPWILPIKLSSTRRTMFSSTSCGDEPGERTVTMTVRKSISGKFWTAIRDPDAMPAIRINSMRRLAATGFPRSRQSTPRPGRIAPVRGFRLWLRSFSAHRQWAISRTLYNLTSEQGRRSRLAQWTKSRQKIRHVHVISSCSDWRPPGSGHGVPQRWAATGAASNQTLCTVMLWHGSHVSNYITYRTKERRTAVCCRDGDNRHIQITATPEVSTGHTDHLGTCHSDDSVMTDSAETMEGHRKPLPVCDRVAGC